MQSDYYGLCEWNPWDNRPSIWCPDNDEYVGCRNKATVSVGASNNNWHLCESCATLPKFKQYRTRKPIWKGKEKNDVQV